MFKAMLMSLWCLYTNHQKFANLTWHTGLHLFHEHKWQCLHSVPWSGAQLLVSSVDFPSALHSLSSRDLAATQETLQSAILRLQGCPKVLGTFKAKGDIWGHVGHARSDGGMEGFLPKPAWISSHSHKPEHLCPQRPIKLLPHLLFPYSFLLVSSLCSSPVISYYQRQKPAAKRQPTWIWQICCFQNLNKSNKVLLLVWPLEYVHCTFQ